MGAWGEGSFLQPESRSLWPALGSQVFEDLPSHPTRIPYLTPLILGHEKVGMRHETQALLGSDHPTIISETLLLY